MVHSSQNICITIYVPVPVGIHIHNAANTKEQLQNENFAWCASNRILICIAFLFVYFSVKCTHADWLYLYRWYFCRIPIPSAFCSLALPVPLSCISRPPVVFNFQFNLKCTLCMNRKFLIIIVMISFLFRFVSFRFFYFILFFILCAYCHQQVMWAFAYKVWLQYTHYSPISRLLYFYVPVYICSFYLFCSHPYILARPHRNDLLLREKIVQSYLLY